MKKQDVRKQEELKRRIVEAKKKDIAIDVLQLNKEIKRMKADIEKNIMKFDRYKSKFANQRLISNKIELLKRVLIGTRYGLDRQTVRLFDIDEYPLQENQ